MSAKRQKLLHRNVPLSETFLTQDTPYVPPASQRNGWRWEAEQRRNAPKEQAPRIVPRRQEHDPQENSPQEHNLRDPFDALGDDEVFLIIALLPAQDTETLRRVSKLWKTKSEVHCGRSALLKHFPWALEKADGCETKEVNLLFRRCLYYQESLEVGFATRAIRCDGASDWHLHDNRLLWYRADEASSIRDLRAADHRSITESDSTELDIGDAIPDGTCRRYLQVVPGGDFLVTTLLNKGAVDQAHQLTRISAGGSVVWSLDLEANMTRPVIGKESVYFVHGPCLEDDVRECKMSFAKHRLCDGSIIFDVTMPPETRIRRKMLDFDGSLSLTGNERLVSWGEITRSEAYIFSTSTGQVLTKAHQPRSQEFSPLLQNVGPNTYTVGFWNTSELVAMLSSYDETSNDFLEVQEYQLDGGLTGDPPFVTFDDGHSVFLHVLHPSAGDSGGRTNHFAQLAILPAARASDSELESSHSTIPITLPGRSKADGKRRELELELPWKFKDGDFFGMMNNYLVYHSRENEFLVLVDFWPVW